MVTRIDVPRNHRIILLCASLVAGHGVENEWRVTNENAIRRIIDYCLMAIGRGRRRIPRSAAGVCHQGPLIGGRRVRGEDRWRQRVTDALLYSLFRKRTADWLPLLSVVIFL